MVKNCVTSNNVGTVGVNRQVLYHVKCDSGAMLVTGHENASVKSPASVGRAWIAVDFAAVSFVLLGLLFGHAGVGSGFVAFGLCAVRMVFVCAVANRTNGWLILLSMFAFVSTIVACLAWDSNVWYHVPVGVVWVMTRLILTVMRAYFRLTWMTVSNDALLSWTAGFSLIHVGVFSLQLFEKGNLWNPFSITDDRIFSVFAGFFAYVEMIAALVYACVIRKVLIGLWFNFVGVVRALRLRCLRFLREPWRDAGGGAEFRVRSRMMSAVVRLLDEVAFFERKIPAEVWNRMGDADRCDKPDESVRRYALLGDRFMALCLEDYCFSWNLTPAAVSDARVKLLTNKALAKFFDSQMGCRYANMLDRSKERKGTFVEAMVGVTVVDFTDCWSVCEPILESLARVLGCRQVFSGLRGVWKNESVQMDCNFDVRFVDELYSTYRLGAFDWAKFFRWYGRDAVFDRKFLKRLARLGRAVLEAEYVRRRVIDEDVAAMTGGAAALYNEVALARVWNTVAEKMKGGVMVLNAKPASENFLAVVAMMYHVGDFLVLGQLIDRL